MYVTTPTSGSLFRCLPISGTLFEISARRAPATKISYYSQAHLPPRTLGILAFFIRAGNTLSFSLFPLFQQAFYGKDILRLIFN